jgi:hypothetical protein
MSVSSVERILDVAVRDIYKADCSILHYGPPHEEIKIEAGSPRHKEYKDGGRVLRWYLGLMGDTSPAISPLSVDVAGDKHYRVYRYDWVFGVSLPNVCGPDPGELWWDWQKALGKATSVAVQMIIRPGDSGIGYTCVATNLNVLPPSRDTETWWQKNRGGVIDIVKAGAKTAEEIYPGMITKAFAALSNSLDARGKWRRTNWFIYQFLDSTTQACAVEWRINKKVLNQYGPLLRGSLVLAFHGGRRRGARVKKGIRLELRPQLGFNPRDELSRVTPTFKLKQDQQVQLEILPRATEGIG